MASSDFMAICSHHKEQTTSAMHFVCKAVIDIIEFVVAVLQLGGERGNGLEL